MGAGRYNTNKRVNTATSAAAKQRAAALASGPAYPVVSDPVFNLPVKFASLSSPFDAGSDPFAVHESPLYRAPVRPDKRRLDRAREADEKPGGPGRGGSSFPGDCAVSRPVLPGLSSPFPGARRSDGAVEDVVVCLPL